MHNRKIIALLATIITILLTFAAVIPVVMAATPSTSTPAPNVIEKEKSYNCLSPIGVQPPVTIVSLAPRLDTIKGKTIYVNQGEADPVIMPALCDRLTKDYPDTDWHLIASSSFGPAAPEDEVKANAKAVSLVPSNVLYIEIAMLSMLVDSWATPTKT